MYDRAFKSRIIESLSTLFWKKLDGKLEENIHKTGNLLTISKEEGATITATTFLNQLLQCNEIKAEKICNILPLHKTLGLL